MIFRNKPAPAYTLRFHPEADGGPEHLLWTLNGFVLQFKKNSKIVAEGESFHDTLPGNKPVVQVSAFNEDSGLFDGPTKTLNLYEDFDEIIYL